MAYSNTKKTSTLSLPEEIVFAILVHLPADVLYYCLRLVCRQWYNIISSPYFIREHLGRCTTGLLSQHDWGSEVPTFTTFEEESNPIESKTSLPWGTEIHATFDGLAVVCVGNKFYVANLVTKQTMPLPPLNVQPHRVNLYKFGLVCGQSANEYKVFLARRLNRFSPTQVTFITLGKDSAWVAMESGGLVDYLQESMHLVWKVISIGRSAYWFFGPTDPVIAYDADSESFHRLPYPVVREHEWREQTCVAAGERTSVVVEEEQDGVFSVWYMPDDDDDDYRRERRTKKKKKMGGVERIDVSEYLPSSKFVTEPITPVAWVNNGELLVFQKFYDRLFAYNVKTGKSFEFGELKGWFGFTGDFVYSLVPLAPSTVKLLAAPTTPI